MEKSGYFDQPDSHRKLALEVEGQKFWVSREVLASYSPIFKVMFYGEFAEANKDVITLPDKKAKDVEELLLCLIPHPHVKEVSNSNLTLLLAYAEEYQIQDLFLRTEQFLVSKIKTCEKADEALLCMLTIGSKYRMKRFLIHCIERCAKEFPFSKLKSEFPNLRPEVVASLAIAAMELPVNSECRFSHFEKADDSEVCFYCTHKPKYNLMKCTLCGRIYCGDCIWHLRVDAKNCAGDANSAKKDTLDLLNWA